MQKRADYKVKSARLVKIKASTSIMDIQNILPRYHNFKEKKLKDRFFKHSDNLALFAKLSPAFKLTPLGNSVRGKSINLITWGNGETKIMLWSQMHGDEATGTMALFDLLNFLQIENDNLVKLIEQECKLYIIPMVNPDGAEQFTRRNALQIDINRDYLTVVSPEAKILKQCRADLKPHFGFNLHDQNTLWSVNQTFKPATLSFLAPATDYTLSVNKTRKSAMLVIADIFKDLNNLLPNQIGLFDDEFEPRAFGDNFQQAGTATILIEAGGFKNDYEKQDIRKYYFAAILSGLTSIASKSYLKQDLANYLIIPKNTKQLFHILIKNVILNTYKTDIGINYEETIINNGLNATKIYKIEDIGDLSFYGAYQIFEGENLAINGEIIFNQLANFDLVAKKQSLLSFQNGKLIKNTLHSTAN